MLYLIKYRRSEKRLEGVIDFPNDRIEEARRERTRLESLSAEQGGDLEVVLFGASSLDALKTTHARYFETLDDIRRNIQQAINVQVS